MKLLRLVIASMLVLVLWSGNDPLAAGAAQGVARPTDYLQFGSSVALDGDTAMIGAPGLDHTYIFYRNHGGANAWGVVQNHSDGNWSNCSVAVGGDIAVVGAPADDAIHIFYRNQDGLDQWGRVKTIPIGGHFGWAVAISADTIVAGAPATMINNTTPGVVYIFQRNWGGADQWGLVNQLVAADGADGDSFGTSVSISGDIVVVGAPDVNVSGKTNQGAAYVFYRNQGGSNHWGQVKKIVASDGAALDFFSESVAIYGDKIVVGASHADISGKSNQGAAYVFYKDRGGINNWGQVKRIVMYSRWLGAGRGI